MGFQCRVNLFEHGRADSGCTDRHNDFTGMRKPAEFRYLFTGKWGIYGCDLASRWRAPSARYNGGNCNAILPVLAQGDIDGCSEPRSGQPLGARPRD